MSSRDDFEAAMVATLDTTAPVAYLKINRVSDELYQFHDDMLTAVMNVGWWAWRAGRDHLVKEAQTTVASQEVPDVIH